MNVEFTISCKEYTNEDLSHIMTDALDIVSPEELIKCIYYDKPYEMPYPNITRELADIQKGLIENAYRFVKIDIPYEVTISGDSVRSLYTLEDTLYKEMAKKAAKHIKEGLIKIVWCGNDEIYNGHIDSLFCASLYKNEQGGVLIAKDIGNIIVI